MYKRWKSALFPSASYIPANDDTQHEILLAPEEQDDTAELEQFPLIVYWVWLFIYYRYKITDERMF